MSYWYAIRCNIKCEDKAERNLRAAGFRTYAPWQRFEAFNRRKRVWIQHEKRLTPRYIFLEVEQHRDAVPWGIIRACEGVEHVLGVNGLPEPLNDKRPRNAPADYQTEVEALHAIMDAERNFEFDETRVGKLHRREIGRTKAETTKMRFPVGAKIRARKGPFAAFEGQVTNVNGRGQVLALISLLNGKVPVEFPVDWIERVEISGEAA